MSYSTWGITYTPVPDEFVASYASEAMAKWQEFINSMDVDYSEVIGYLTGQDTGVLSAYECDTEKLTALYDAVVKAFMLHGIEVQLFTTDSCGDQQDGSEYEGFIVLNHYIPNPEFTPDMHSKLFMQEFIGGG